MVGWERWESEVGCELLPFKEDLVAERVSLRCVAEMVTCKDGGGAIVDPNRSQPTAVNWRCMTSAAKMSASPRVRAMPMVVSTVVHTVRVVYPLGTPYPVYCAGQVCAPIIY